MTETATPSPAGGRSGALFLNDAEVFTFDFGGAVGPRGVNPAASALSSYNNDNNNDDDDAFTAPVNGGNEEEEEEDDFRGRCDNDDATPTGQREGIAVRPLELADVQYAFHAALDAGERVFLQLPPEEAVTRFQVGLRRYGVALHRQTKQRRHERLQRQRGGAVNQREGRPHKRHRGGSNINNGNRESSRHGRM